jgi:PilZ domain
MKSQIRSKLWSLVQRRLQVERRRVKRLVPSRRTFCQFQGPGDELATAGSVQDLSLKGAGILAPRNYPPGTSLHLLLVNAAHTFSLTVDLTVIRSSRAANGQYFLAGPFGRELLHDEVVPFVV